MLLRHFVRSEPAIGEELLDLCDQLRWRLELYEQVLTAEGTREGDSRRRDPAGGVSKDRWLESAICLSLY